MPLRHTILAKTPTQPSNPSNPSNPTMPLCAMLGGIEEAEMNEARYREVERRLWTSLGLEPTERQLDLERLRTRVRVQEVGEGPLVVFIHGGSASGANWAPMLPNLPKARCVLVDRPGCGLSPPAAVDLTDLDAFCEFAETFVVDLIDALELRTANVVATSLGGCYALRGAAAHPDRIERLLEFGYVPGAPLARVPTAMRVATLPGLRHVVQAMPPTAGAVRMIMRQLGLGPALRDGRLTPEMLAWFLSLLRDTDTLRNDSNGPRQLLQKQGRGREILPAAVLREISAPVRFVWGENDPLGGAAVAERFVENFVAAELELWPDASHAPWMDHPRLAAERVKDFFGL